MKDVERSSDKTTITVSRQIRLALEIIKLRYGAVSIDEGLHAYLEEFTPAFLDRATEADKILSSSETH